MGYAVLKGDYMRGGYAVARGDPFGLPIVGGIVAGLGKKLLGKAAGFVGGLIKGGGRKILTGGAGAGRAAQAARAIRGIAGGAAVAAGGTYIGGKLLERGKREPGFRGKRMNPANVKALRRAIRRMEGFQKLAKQTGCLPKPARRSRSSVCRTCK